MQPDDLTTIDEAGTVAFDVNCLRCGYNLRGLPEAGRCPECGEGVERSLRGDLLWLADPAWLRRVRSGIRIAVAGMAAIVFGHVGLLLALALLPFAQFFWMAPLVGSIAWLVFNGGVAWFNARDPSGTDEPGQRRLRAAMSVGVIGGGVAIVWSMLGVYGARGAALPRGFDPIFSLLTSSAVAVGFCAMLLSVARLARRLPDERLASRARTLARVMGVTFGGMLILPFVARILIARGPGMTAIVIVSLGCLLALLIGGSMCVQLLWVAQRRIGAEAAAVEAIRSVKPG